MAQDFEEFIYRTDLKNFNQIPIDSSWQYHAGDYSPFTDTSYNEQGWKEVTTEYLQDKNAKPIAWPGIGWFRKRFNVPAEWRGKALAMRVGHFGASEIYLDGKLIYRFGTVGRTLEDEKIFVPHQAVIIQPDNKATHLLVVKYSNQHAKTPDYAAKFIGFRILLSPPNLALKPHNELPFIPMIFSILVAFSLFFLIVYSFYPSRLASLLTALLLLNFTSTFVCTYIISINSQWSPIIWATYFGRLSVSWMPCFTLLVFYALYFNGQLPKRTWILAGFMAFYLFFAASMPFRFSWIGLPPFLLIIVETARMLYLGIQIRKTGFWILLIGWIISWLGIIFFIIDVFKWFPESSTALKFLRIVFAAMSVPITYALQLAWEFGTANRDLRRQLIQVHELSETTLRQEQEKQQILSQQNELLEKRVQERTTELIQQKSSLQNTLSELKTTQSQLIQSEKMASLGELTAGIAHEIQNPLNFVNNFSEVNKELIEELKSERSKVKGERDERLEDELLNDISENEQKINLHGKRADAIVKGMLQHSRASTGKKEPTDINALADEYVRLAYHGLRAKDKNFNATIETHFDETVGKIQVVPQDIGRVLLNLYNNAFYAVNERQKAEGESFQPVVKIQTKKVDSKVEVVVKDNGNGIPENVINKIFQPFFTTKPTGQGTGLGLSLSYDIIKAHGGEIKVESEEGEGTTFIVQL
jgi:signal transduction histidine kinase